MVKITAARKSDLMPVTFTAETNIISNGPSTQPANPAYHQLVVELEGGVSEFIFPILNNGAQ